MNIERKRRDVVKRRQDSLEDDDLVRALGPGFLARNTSAMPPAPSRLTISKSARWRDDGCGHGAR